jgi:hypothetical protein
MLSFKMFWEAKALGLIENLTIDGIGTIPSKIDSGNGAYNVLHGVDINISGDTVQFTSVDNHPIEAQMVDTIEINIGSGVIEKRPVIHLNVTIGDHKFENVRFSIGDRTENEYKILVGKDFIEELGGLIDVTTEFNYK